VVSVSYPGSRSALGLMKPEGLSIARQDTGRSLADHMREEGFDPDAVARVNMRSDRTMSRDTWKCISSRGRCWTPKKFQSAS